MSRLAACPLVCACLAGLPRRQRHPSSACSASIRRPRTTSCSSRSPIRRSAPMRLTKLEYMFASPQGHDGRRGRAAARARGAGGRGRRASRSRSTAMRRKPMTAARQAHRRARSDRAHVQGIGADPTTLSLDPPAVRRSTTGVPSRRHHETIAGFSSLVACARVASPAVAGKKYGKQVRYAGIHPIPKSEGGGICHIEGPHVHIYAANKLEYRVHGDDNVLRRRPGRVRLGRPEVRLQGPPPDPRRRGRRRSSPTSSTATSTARTITTSSRPTAPTSRSPAARTSTSARRRRRTSRRARTYVGDQRDYEPIVYTRPVIEVAPPAGWVSTSTSSRPPSSSIRVRAPVVVAPRGRVDAASSVDVHIPVPTIAGRRRCRRRRRR